MISKNWMAASVLGIVGAVSGVAAASGSSTREPHTVASPQLSCFEEAVVLSQMNVATVQMEAEDEALRELLARAEASGGASEAVMMEMQAHMSSLWSARKRGDALLGLLFRPLSLEVVPRDCHTERWPHIT